MQLSDVAPAVSIDTVRVIRHDGEVSDVTWLGTDGATWGAFGSDGRFRVFRSLAPADEPIIPETYVSGPTISGRELLGLMAGSAPIVVDLGAASDSDDLAARLNDMANQHHEAGHPISASLLRTAVNRLRNEEGAR